MMGMILITLMPILRLVGTLWTGRLLRNRRPHWVYWSLNSIHIPYWVGIWPLERISHLSRRRRIMETERMIIHPSFCASASRLMGMLWLPIWCSVLVGLWGSVRVEAQDASADRMSIFELHFEEDSLRVVRNEMRRTRRADSEAGLDSASVEAASRAPSTPRFPFQAVANNQAKKVVWFNADGTIKARRSIPEGRKALVSANGAYVLLVKEKHSYYTQQVELQDAQGARLWEAELHSNVRLSPTGEMVVSLREESTKGAPFSIWGPQGKLAEYETEARRVSFSADGQFLFAKEIARGTNCASLFNKQGQRLWQRHCNRGRVRSITDVFVSESGRFIAFSFSGPDSHVGDTPNRYLSVLDHEGDIVWTQPAGSIYELSFSEKDSLIVMLNNKYVGAIIGDRDSEDLEVVVLNARTGVVQRRFPLPDFYGDTWGGCDVFKLVNDELVLGYLKRSREGDFSAHVQVYGPTGVLSWERSLNPGTEDWDSAVPVWSQRGSLIGISIGQVFQLFDVSRHNLSEE